MSVSISKMLSANDTGETGGHQAGIHVPKERRLLAFFPSLDPSILNPRCHLFFEEKNGQRWEFAFIYYNNRFFGGTRNEYRLTRMTKYMVKYDLKTGDKIVLDRLAEDQYRVRYERKDQPERKDGVLKLGAGWRIIDI